MKSESKSILLSIAYFGLSMLITSWFIFKGIDFYSGLNSMILSGVIAGGKWLLQILASLLFLDKNKWLFIKRIALVCLIGSLLLFSYFLIGFLGITGGLQFTLSLIIAVTGMLILYFNAVTHTNLPIYWYLGWLTCLTIAITLQLTVVFHLI